MEKKNKAWNREKQTQMPVTEFMIQCDREIKARKPDIVVVNKNERSCVIIHIVIPGDISKS